MDVIVKAYFYALDGHKLVCRRVKDMGTGLENSQDVVPISERRAISYEIVITKEKRVNWE